MIGVSYGTSVTSLWIDKASRAFFLVLDFYTRADLFLLSCKGMQASLLARFVPKEEKKRSFWASKASSTFTVVSLCEKTEEYSLLFVPPLDFCAICSVPLQATLLVVNIAKGDSFF